MEKEIRYTMEVLGKQPLPKLMESILGFKNSNQIIEETPISLDKEKIREIIKFLFLEGDVAYIQGLSYPFSFGDPKILEDLLIKHDWGLKF